MFFKIHKLVKTKKGRALLSILWGLGLAALFQRVCKGRNCIVLSAPNPNKLKNKIFKDDDENKCYKYVTSNVKCSDDSIKNYLM